SRPATLAWLFAAGALLAAHKRSDHNGGGGPKKGRRTVSRALLGAANASMLMWRFLAVPLPAAGGKSPPENVGKT
ncbi:MAG TPA: hypothetical protein PKK10_18085, partial [Woeseiaceae bacterium]|nr:hypothetical protein [Woeseiaceae bacterium]